MVSGKTKASVKRKCEKTVVRLKQKERVTPRMKIKLLFFVMKTAQKMIDKSERKAGRESTKDYMYWKENGWIGGKKPWRSKS
jgi:hypothetical protein